MTCETYCCQDSLCGRRGKDVPCHSCCEHARADIPIMCWLMSAASTCDIQGAQGPGEEGTIWKQGDRWNEAMNMADLRSLPPCLYLPPD